MDKDELWDLVAKVNKSHELAQDEDWMNECDWEEFILLMSLRNPQSYGSLIQNQIIEALNGKKVKSNLNLGDVLINNNYYEIKASILTPSNNIMNLVQIRLWQKVRGYLCFAFDIRKKDNFRIYQYFLTHDQMQHEVDLLGSSAHGTKTVTAQNKHNEKAIRINIDDNDSNFLKWQKEYHRIMLE